MSMLKPKTCPHEDCVKTFTKFVKKQGILFCPHCQKSFIAKSNFDIKLLEKLKQNHFSFFEYLKIDIIENKVSWGLLPLSIAFFWWLQEFASDNVREFYQNSFLILFVSFLLLILLVIIFAQFTQKANKYKPKQSNTFSLRNKQLFKGVDNLAEISHASPTDFFMPINSTIDCPNCHSQQLISYPKYLENHTISAEQAVPFDPNFKQQYEYYVCNKCQSVLHQNAQFTKLENRKGIARTILMIIIFAKKFDVSFFAIWAITYNLVHAYFDYLKSKTPYWDNVKTPTLSS